MNGTLLLRGAPAADALAEKSAAACRRLAEQGVTPRLALVRVGERAGDLSYEQSIARRCRAVGVHVQSDVLDESISESALLDRLAQLSGDRRIHGILPLLPLPERFDTDRFRRAIAPKKDVDGITDGSLGALMTGGTRGFAPCTAEAVIEILRYYGIAVAGRSAVILGRSIVVGKPAAMLLLRADATVTVCHSRTRNAAELCRRADILVTAIGKAGCIGQRGTGILHGALNRGHGLLGLFDRGRRELLRGARVGADGSFVPGGLGVFRAERTVRRFQRRADDGRRDQRKSEHKAENSGNAFQFHSRAPPSIASAFSRRPPVARTMMLCSFRSSPRSSPRISPWNMTSARSHRRMISCASLDRMQTATPFSARRRMMS